MHYMNDIAKALNEYRLNRGWKFRQLAAASGIPLTTLHSIIKRGQKPSELTRHLILTRLPGLSELIDRKQCAGTDSAN
jgi:predicted transcriptional regulator